MKQVSILFTLISCMISSIPLISAAEDVEDSFTLYSKCDSQENYSELSVEEVTCNGLACLEYKNEGGNYGSWVYVSNKSNEKIWVTIRAYWTYNGEVREELKTHHLLKNEKKHIGYTRWKDQVIHYEILASGKEL